jgi:hypothetical protein
MLCAFGPNRHGPERNGELQRGGEAIAEVNVAGHHPIRQPPLELGEGVALQ